MQADFWQDLWQRGQIHFHQSAVCRHLSLHWQNLDVTTGGRVFVPLCGKSLDLLWLRDRGHAVVGVELSAIALQSFCMENGVPARRRIAADFDIYEAPRLELFCGDFFALTPAHLADMAAVYDRASLISWNPELRERYAEHMTRLTPSGIETLLVTLEYPQAERAGPPFSVPAAEVTRLYGAHHAIRELSRQDVLADEPRMRARGVSELYEVCYRLTRL